MEPNMTNQITKSDDGSASMIGRIVITDLATGEVVLEKNNAIHPQNMGIAIARSLARDPNGTIYKMSFGNGGTFLNSSGQIVYRPPNTTGDADLYNLTYEVQVDDQSANTPTTNSVTSAQSPTPSITSIITVTAVLNAGEPSGQALGDNTNTNPNSPYTFNELGLKTQDSLLLSHLVFSPIEKTSNRAFLILYTITVTVS
jgi:hypothetical protein